MQTERLFNIIYLLLDHDSLTTTQLAKKLEVSTRTIRRDVERLSGTGIPIYMTRGKGGGVHLMPQFVLTKSLLNTHEQDEILLALQTMRGIDASPEKAEQLDTLQRLSVLFQRQQNDWLDIEFGAWGGVPETKYHFALCREAIFQKRTVCFEYFATHLLTEEQKKTFRPKEAISQQRTVEPYRLVFRENNWYLQAFCLLRNNWRFFKLSRMRNVVIGTDPFIPRQEVPPPNFQRSGVKLLKFRALFDKMIAFRVYDEMPLDSITEQDDGSLLVEAEVSAELWMPSYLLSFGAFVKILEPKEWQDFVRQQATEILRQHRDNPNA